MNTNDITRLAELGVATVYEASGRDGLIDIPLIQIVPKSLVAGPARTVLCGQDDNLMVHAAIEQIQPGEVLVLTMPEPAPVALIGDLLATQVKVRQAAGILVDASVRDVSELVELELPIWRCPGCGWRCVRQTRTRGVSIESLRRTTGKGRCTTQEIACGADFV
jgi:4-hydroxy-4-methyl-2-oxoglutarate aldolase